jgi:hypothetical protein
MKWVQRSTLLMLPVLGSSGVVFCADAATHAEFALFVVAFVCSTVMTLTLAGRTLYLRFGSCIGVAAAMSAVGLLIVSLHPEETDVSQAEIVALLLLAAYILWLIFALAEFAGKLQEKEQQKV